MKKIEKLSTRNYILVGDENTIKTAINELQWGFSERNKRFWNTSEIGEKIAFYVTKPTKKIIGFGIIQNKIIDNRLTWPDEILFKKSLWPLRFQIKLLFTTKNWNDGIEPPANLMLNVGRKVIEKKEFLKLYNTAKKNWT